MRAAALLLLLAACVPARERRFEPRATPERQWEALLALRDAALAVGDSTRAHELDSELRALEAGPRSPARRPAPSTSLPAPDSPEAMATATLARAYEDLWHRVQARYAELERAGRREEAIALARKAVSADDLARSGKIAEASDLLRQALSFPRP